MQAIELGSHQELLAQRGARESQLISRWLRFPARYGFLAMLDKNAQVQSVSRLQKY